MSTATSASAGLPSFTHRFCVAPMMDYTDRHCRFLLRLASRRARLYTEMVTAAALVRGRDPGHLLDFNDAEHPVAMQLGGSDPALLAQAATLAAARGYDEVNLNIGCPSDRVTAGRFGACLMAEPELVADCVAAMRDAVGIPITVKTRIGIDDRNDPGFLDAFIGTVAAAGCTTFIIHARKAWLKGLSPKENREIPPLNYDRVYQLKRTFPRLAFILNGGIRTVEEADAALAPREGTVLDGVMMGRAAYESPLRLAAVDRQLFGSTDDVPDRRTIADAYLAYAARMIGDGARPHHVLRHAVALFHGCAGARRWRQAITAAGQCQGSVQELVALAHALGQPQPLAA